MKSSACVFDHQDAKHGAEIKAVDAYCWLHSTVNLDPSLMRKLNTLPKLRNPCQGFPTEAEYDVDTLYYQWVPFFLLFQVLGNEHIFNYETSRRKQGLKLEILNFMACILCGNLVFSLLDFKITEENLWIYYYI